MVQTTVTAENIDATREQMPCDQASEVAVGCVVTRWSPGDVLFANGQHNSEPITTTVWPDKLRAAWCYGADSVWGDVDGDILTPDDGDERYDLTTGGYVATRYEARMDGVSEDIQADTLENALAATKAWIADGSWDTSDGTAWITGYCVAIAPNGEETPHSVTVTIEPDEPKCEDGEDHDWQSPLSIVGGIKENPGVWGHGGGVTIQEVCMHCGCGKLTDTWAQDRETGRQGLRSVKYEPGKYAGQIPEREDA